MDAVALAVIKGIVDGVDLKFAGVARTRIDLADRQASPEAAPDGLLQFHDDLFELRIGDRGKRLGDDAGAEDLLQDSDHNAPQLSLRGAKRRGNLFSPMDIKVAIASLYSQRRLKDFLNGLTTGTMGDRSLRSLGRRTKRPLC